MQRLTAPAPAITITPDTLLDAIVEASAPIAARKLPQVAPIVAPRQAATVAGRLALARARLAAAPIIAPKAPVAAIAPIVAPRVGNVSAKQARVLERLGYGYATIETMAADAARRIIGQAAKRGWKRRVCGTCGKPIGACRAGECSRYKE
jgi:hypothetical protein